MCNEDTNNEMANADTDEDKNQSFNVEIIAKNSVEIIHPIPPSPSIYNGPQLIICPFGFSKGDNGKCTKNKRPQSPVKQK